MGLRWSDVELDNRHVFVRQQICGECGEVNEPKTRAGVRQVELPAAAVSELRRWKLRCSKDKPGTYDYVVPARDGGAMCHFNYRASSIGRCIAQSFAT
jgi:integrase